MSRKTLYQRDLRFEVGMSSLDVCKLIVTSYPDIEQIQIISHTVELNWRQKYPSVGEKVKALDEAFDYHIYGSRKIRQWKRVKFLSINVTEVAKDLEVQEVYSFTSKVRLVNGKYMHIPMMNFHPEEGVSIDHIERIVERICGRQQGVLLATGRYYHYFGNFLLAEDDWVKFMGAFLLPCIAVSPKYIGHRLLDGYSTLRLTTEPKYKSCLPTVIRIIQGNEERRLWTINTCQKEHTTSS